MLGIKEIVFIQMNKMGLKNINELCELMNKGSKGEKFYKEHINNVLLGRRSSLSYLYRMEEVFGLPTNFLVNMVDLSNKRKSNIKE